MSSLQHLADRRYPLSPLNWPPEIVGNRADGRIRPVLDRPRVAIYGAGLGRSEAPLDDPKWAVWALNTIPPLDRQRRLRCDLWWDLHQRQAQSADDLRWIAACPVPIMVPLDLLDAGPRCVRYPIETIEAEIAPGPFACSFAYMIAYALWLGYRDIGLYGVELAYGTARERTVEYASVSWWMGFAAARGVLFYRPRLIGHDVTPTESRVVGSLLGQHPAHYGLEYDAEKRAVEAYLWRARGVSAIDDNIPADSRELEPIA